MSRAPAAGLPSLIPTTREERLKSLGRRAALGSVSAAISTLAALRRESPGAYQPTAVRRILAVRLDPLGDLLLTRPALAALRAAFPDARIDLLALPYTAPIARLFPEIETVYEYDIHRLRPSGDLFEVRQYRRLAELRQTLRANRYDLAIAFCGRVASFFAWAAGARWRFGYQGEAARQTLTDALPGRRYDRRHHEAAYCLDLAAAVGAAVRPPFRPLPIPAELDRRGAAEWPAWWAAGSPRVVLHPGASNGWAKRWPTAGFADLAGRLAERLGARIAVTGSAGEAELAQPIVAAAPDHAIDFTGRLDLTGLAAALAQADLVISGDSGPLHLAGQLGRPVVGIYGPSDPALSGPFERAALVVRQDLPCSPCYDATYPAICPLVHHRCMRDLTVEPVWAAVAAALATAVPDEVRR